MAQSDEAVEELIDLDYELLILNFNYFKFYFTNFFSIELSGQNLPVFHKHELLILKIYLRLPKQCGSIDVHLQDSSSLASFFTANP